MLYMRVMLLLFVSASVLLANTIHVPADYTTIQEAINASMNGDTVIVASGIYVENISFNGKAITVASENPSNPQVIENTIIDGNLTGAVVTFDCGEGVDSVIEGFTITNGSGAYFPQGHIDFYGGGIFCRSSSPTIRNNLICWNFIPILFMGKGGGIACILESFPEITGNTILNNSSKKGAGGIHCDYTSIAMVTDCLIEKNSTLYYGGGIHCSKGHIIGCIIKNNHAIEWGGGIYCRDETTIIEDCLIVENTAIDNGGGIYCESCEPIIRNCTIRNNKSHGEFSLNGGGAVYSNWADPVIESCLFENNWAAQGGGVFLFHGSLEIVNSIFFENKADQSGGGIFLHDSEMNLTNCTMIRNSSYAGGAILIWGAASVVNIFNSILWMNEKNQIKGSPISVTCSDVQGGWPGTGNIDTDPMFVDLGKNDFHLTYDSPCRDTGDNSVVTELYDFEGDPRIAWSGTVDMGADEFFTHLYITGNNTPGGSIKGNFIGLPSTTPVGLFIGTGILHAPASTMWGEFWLQSPWVFLGPLGAIPADGVMVLHTTLPGSIQAPYDAPMQALIGLNTDSLSNLYVMEVR